MGSVDSSYHIPSEAKRILEQEILCNALHADLPPEIHNLVDRVEFVGSALPSIAINWRFAESISSLKGLEACMINVLLRRRYGEVPHKVIINTDHAQLFFMSALLLQVDPEPGSAIEGTPVRELSRKYASHFPDEDRHQMASSWYRRAASNIYKAKDGRFFHIHGSMNPNPSLEAIGFPTDRPEISSAEAGWAVIQDRIATHDAASWDQLLGEEHRQAATICWTAEEYAASEHGRANADVGLYKIHHRPCVIQTRSWWPTTPSTSVNRPLAGLKIVDLTRVIAGPAIGRGLAELGASVMRVTAPHLADFSGLHPDLNWGKWNCHLDLRKNTDREKLRTLILDADVLINGYRPHVLDKYGFGDKSVFELCQSRERGILYVRENCFGWNGPWAHRSGWQPISDANCGISMGFGRAMGNDEAVTPVFPNSDYCTGVIGVCAVLHALIKRAEHGGSYLVDTSLNYYSRWLAASVGEYPREVWDDVWARNGGIVLRHYHSMNYSLPLYLEIVKQCKALANFDFFEVRYTKALGGLPMRCVKPVLQFPPGSVELRYNVGTRGNGVDQPHWPEDLMTEVVN